MYYHRRLLLLPGAASTTVPSPSCGAPQVPHHWPSPFEYPSQAPVRCLSRHLPIQSHQGRPLHFRLPYTSIGLRLSHRRVFRNPGPPIFPHYRLLRSPRLLYKVSAPTLLALRAPAFGCLPRQAASSNRLCRGPLDGNPLPLLKIVLLVLPHA